MKDEDTVNETGEDANEERRRNKQRKEREREDQIKGTSVQDEGDEDKWVKPKQRYEKPSLDNRKQQKGGEGED